MGVRQVPNVPYNERQEAKAAGQQEKGKEAIAANSDARGVQFVLYAVDSIYLSCWEKRGQTASTTAPRVWSSAVELSPCLHILKMRTTVQQKSHPRPWLIRTSPSHSCHTVLELDSRYRMYLDEVIVTWMDLVWLHGRKSLQVQSLADESKAHGYSPVYVITVPSRAMRVKLAARRIIINCCRLTPPPHSLIRAHTPRPTYHCCVNLE